MTMTELPQFASLPIHAGPYNRRRLIRLRAPARQFGMIAAFVTAAGALLALVL